MKVKDLMSLHIITVAPNTPLTEVSRYIFSLGMSGLPVIKNNKLIGVITESDILKKLFPSMEEYIEDPIRSSNFNLIEKKVIEIFDLTAEDIMNKNLITIAPDIPIMKAQSIMLINKFSRLLVVNKSNELVGIITQGDIFKQLVKEKISKMELERYANYTLEYYDQLIDWEKRLTNELPQLIYYFKSNGINKVVDIGTWSGEYSIALAKNDIKVTAVDNSEVMITFCNKKKKNLSPVIQKNIDFKLSQYDTLSKIIDNKQDGLICMGNSLPYIYTSLNKLCSEFYKTLHIKGKVIIQLLNFDKILNKTNRLLSFRIIKHPKKKDKELIIIQFLDILKNKNKLIHNYAIFEETSNSWIFQGMTHVPINYINNDILKKSLFDSGFKKVLTYGYKGQIHYDYGKINFEKPFNHLEDDWSIVIAEK